MSNVVLLFKQETIQNNVSDDPRNSVTIAISEILAASDQLRHTVNELLKHFDAVDQIIDALGDAGIRNQHKLLVKLGRTTLMNAMGELSQTTKRLPRLPAIRP